ncbi:hypothetical protein G3I32_03150 [Streptomyces coelicoflavus]|uniref:AAA family ATPase n=1 Tax=Streptomyces coelicoflavus TaxID=285562 RepID=A0A7K3PD07_9ACTN|nr:hypothetical protein [Streptomyces coelicoflavus]
MRAAVIGREQETASVVELLAGHRLVTITGPAGVGKSTVAAAAVASSAGWECLTQVRWQHAGRGRMGSLAADVITRLTGATPHGPVAPVRAALCLPDAPTLLWLDDVDPVHSECVQLVQRVLLWAPRARVLVTSRTALGLDAERTLRLSGLRVDHAPDEAGPAPAVELFLHRAVPRDSAPDLESVGEVCRLVDGLPLAVVLAAEQTAHLPVRELVPLLRQGQGWLTSGRPATARHGSLRDAVGSAWMLCDQAVRTVWARASIFAGSFTEASAIHMCAGGEVEPTQVAACLGQLAAQGVLEVHGEVGSVRGHRYRMTRMAREFGTERLTAQGELPAAVLRHSQRWARVAAEAESLWDRGAQSRAVRLVLDEYDEITAMLNRARGEAALAPAALQAAVHLWFWWGTCGRADEGAAHLLGLIPHCQEHPLLARGQWLAAWLSAGTAPDTARALLDNAWRSAVLAADTAVIGRIAHVHGVLALQERDVQGAADHFAQAADTIPTHAPDGPPATLSRAALALSQAPFAPTAARRSAHHALAHTDLRHDPWVRQVARYALACTDHALGRTGQACKRAHRALTDADDDPPAWQSVTALRQLLADIAAGTPAGLGPTAVLIPGTAAPLPVRNPFGWELRLGRKP